MEKEREVEVNGWCRRWAEEDWSILTGWYSCRRSLRYAGLINCFALEVRVASLKTTRRLAGSQCSSCRRSVSLAGRHVPGHFIVLNALQSIKVFFCPKQKAVTVVKLSSNDWSPSCLDSHERPDVAQCPGSVLRTQVIALMGWNDNSARFLP